jgi:hypothetical protein
MLLGRRAALVVVVETAPLMGAFPCDAPVGVRSVGWQQLYRRHSVRELLQRVGQIWKRCHAMLGARAHQAVKHRRTPHSIAGPELPDTLYFSINCRHCFLTLIVNNERGEEWLRQPCSETWEFRTDSAPG